MSLFALIHRDLLTSPDQKSQTSALVNEFDNVVAQLSAWALVNHNEDGTHNTRTTSGLDLIPVGGMIKWSGISTPTGWLPCDGRAISRAEFPKLFAAYGITSGAGDGSTTFNIPTQAGFIILVA